MDRPYWDQVAQNYDQHIFSSMHADQSGVIRDQLDALADPNKTVLDLGCGVGKYLPDLSKRFGRVVGVDHSEKLLQVARSDHGHLENVELQCVDASEGKRIRGVKADVVVCANVLIMPQASVQQSILRLARQALSPEGRLLLVVPSLESALLSHRRLVEWHQREGAADPEAEAETEGMPPSKRTAQELLRGLVRIENVPTKHHLADELSITLKDSGLKLMKLKKVPYSWHSEFAKPPKWMADPYPWDWLALASRRK